MVTKTSRMHARRANYSLRVHREVARMALAGEANFDRAKADLAWEMQRMAGESSFLMTLLQRWQRILETEDWPAMLEESKEGISLRACSPVMRVVNSKVRRELLLLNAKCERAIDLSLGVSLR